MIPVLRALLITLIVVGAILGAVYVGTGGNTGLKRAALQYLELYWTDGITEASKLTSETNAKGAHRQDLEALRKRYIKLLGAYVGMDEVVSEHVDSEGRGHIDIRFSFEKGKALAHYVFLRDGDVWEVDEFRIEVPRELEPDVKRSEPGVFSSKLAWHWAEGRTAIVWEQFSPELRTLLPLAAFQERSEALFEQYGAYEERKTIAFEEDGEKSAHGSIEIRFEKGTRQVDMQVVWDGSRWYASRFDVEGLR